MVTTERITASQIKPIAAPLSGPGRYLNLTADDIEKFKRLIAQYSDPNHVRTRPLSQSEDTATVPEIKPEPLSLGGPQIDASDFKPAFQQLAGNLPLLKVLTRGNPEIQKLIDQAREEHQMLGVKYA